MQKNFLVLVGVVEVVHEVRKQLKGFETIGEYCDHGGVEKENRYIVYVEREASTFTELGALSYSTVDLNFFF